MGGWESVHIHVHVVLKDRMASKTGRNKIAFAVIVSHKPVAIYMIIGVLHMHVHVHVLH